VDLSVRLSLERIERADKLDVSQVFLFSWRQAVVVERDLLQEERGAIGGLLPENHPELWFAIPFANVLVELGFGEPEAKDPILVGAHDAQQVVSRGVFFVNRDVEPHAWTLVAIEDPSTHVVKRHHIFLAINSLSASALDKSLP
jgi:hypothetical protein